jgi:hypothetical protein
MVDFAGLIQPEVANQLTRDSTYLDTSSWAVQNYEPEYVLLDEGLAASLSSRAWFADSHQRVRSFANSERQVMSLYQRVDSQ